MEGPEAIIAFEKDPSSGEIKFNLETEARNFTKETTTFSMESKTGKKTFAATYWKPTLPNPVKVTTSGIRTPDIQLAERFLSLNNFQNNQQKTVALI